MKNTIIGALVIVAVVLVVLFTGGKKDGNTSDTSQEKMSGTFENLIANGKSYECTFSKSDEQGDVSGKVYVENKDMLYGDYQMTDKDGNNFDIEIIRDGEYNYVWGTSSFGDMAVKTKISDEGDSPSKDNTNILESEEEYDFDCKNWKVKDSMFIPPSDIEFNEFSIPSFNLDTSANGSVQSSSAPSQSEICSSCDSAPAGAARDQCLQAISVFGCPAE